MSNKIRLTIRIDPDIYEEAKEYAEELTKQTLNKYINKAISNYNHYNRKIMAEKYQMNDPKYLRMLASILEEKAKEPETIEEVVLNGMHETNNN